MAIAAEQGSSEAQLHLGIALYNGGGLYRSDAPRRQKEGLPWIARAAEAGEPLAWTWIGWAYQDGVAVPQDLEQAAAAWYRAAELGDAPGANALALAYRDGIGVPRNDRLYRAWSERAAELGHAGAREAMLRRGAADERTKGNMIALLVLLGLVAGGAGAAPRGTHFMDPSDPMQAWGMDLMMRIK